MPLNPQAILVEEGRLQFAKSRERNGQRAFAFVGVHLITSTTLPIHIPASPYHRLLNPAGNCYVPPPFWTHRSLEPEQHMDTSLNGILALVLTGAPQAVSLRMFLTSPSLRRPISCTWFSLSRTRKFTGITSLDAKYHIDPASFFFLSGSFSKTPSLASAIRDGAVGEAVSLAHFSCATGSHARPPFQLFVNSRSQVHSLRNSEQYLFQIQ